MKKFHRRYSLAFAATLTATLCALACTGSIGEGSRGSPNSDEPGAGGAAGGSDSLDAPPLLEPGTPAQLCKAPKPGVLLNRRLTQTQFQNAVTDLFGAAAAGPSTFPKTSVREGYRTFAIANAVTADGAEQIAGAVATVASKATANLNTLMGCTPGAAGDDGCARGYIQKLARKAYRRPAQSGELETLNNAYAKLIAAQFSPAEATASVIEIVLQSPQFLYLSQLGKDAGAAGDVVPLTDHEIASRLSFFLWDAPPTADLAKLADDSKLHTPADVEAQARKMLDDPRVESIFPQFLEDWLELYRLDSQTKDAKKFPEWNDALAVAMRTEVGKTANEIAFRGDATFKFLLSGTRTVTNGALAKVYGVTANMGEKFEAVTLDQNQRSGLLTSTGFLAAHGGSQESLPVARGAFVRRHMLCQELVIPAGLVIKTPEIDPNVRGRERFSQHRVDPKCSGCHALMDPLGFGLEGYDALGKFRTTEGNGLKIDASGDIVEGGDISGPFNGGIELSTKLAGSPVVQGCFARQLFSFAIARNYGDEDSCALTFIESKFAESNGNLKELMVSLVLSDNFLYRRVPQ